MAALKVLETQYQMFIKSRIYLDDEYVVMTRNYFLQYTQLKILEFRDTLIQHTYNEYSTYNRNQQSNSPIHAEENNTNQAADAQFEPCEFVQPICNRTRTCWSSHATVEIQICITFNQPQTSNTTGQKDHPCCLEAIRICRYGCPQVFSNLSEKDVENGILNWAMTKALYGLKQAPRAWYDELSNLLDNQVLLKAKYVLEILKKHGMENGQSIGTPMATKPKLDADLSGTLVDQIDYRSKIGSLMYLTSSRPDIVHALRGTINMRLWYPKDFGFKLTAFSDADHARCIDTRKSTSRGIQFLGDKLVSWMSKK
ncbi:hypothetical protein Tco_0584288 [Tanacetum coccineum]